MVGGRSVCDSGDGGEIVVCVWRVLVGLGVGGVG